jgi:uncharacterized protein (UPF0212 family)
VKTTTSEYEKILRAMVAEAAVRACLNRVGGEGVGVSSGTLACPQCGLPALHAQVTVDASRELGPTVSTTARCAACGWKE